MKHGIYDYVKKSHLKFFYEKSYKNWKERKGRNGFNALIFISKKLLTLGTSMLLEMINCMKLLG